MNQLLLEITLLIVGFVLGMISFDYFIHKPMEKSYRGFLARATKTVDLAIDTMTRISNIVSSKEVPRVSPIQPRTK